MDKKKIALAFLYIFLISVIFYFVRKGDVLFPFHPHISPYLSLGFIVIIAHLGGMIAKKSGLPSLTGNLLAGILFGPHLFGFISRSDISSLEMINALALSFIAITAGGELRIAGLKKNALAILNITFFHVLIILPVITGGFYLVIVSTSIIPGIDMRQAFIISMLLGTIALAKSPASTIAVINEYRSKGTFTDIVLGVTMLKDIVVLIIFALVMAIASGMLSNQPFSLLFLLGLIGHIILSGTAGVIYGFLMILFYKYVAREIGIFIIIASYLAHDLASLIGLEHMFMCMVAGFVVQNFSKQGYLMIESIENTHLPIYVVFFAIAGAGLGFEYFKSSFIVVLLFVMVRMVLIYLATYAGAAAAGAVKSIRHYSWTGFLTNAGLTLSVVIIVENTFPGWGSMLKAIVISVIAINQVIGPVLFKYGLIRSGEATRL
jgi:Kef-type K+ transport system membrane component KefB